MIKLRLNIEINSVHRNPKKYLEAVSAAKDAIEKALVEMEIKMNEELPESRVHVKSYELPQQRRFWGGRESAWSD